MFKINDGREFGLLENYHVKRIMILFHTIIIFNKIKNILKNEKVLLKFYQIVLRN